ncbi:NAD(P)H nitroreductase [Actinoplanes lobatus]|uniref:Nitroreductase n=1 Tax=Actinoplanes lobatus TaxID=113568 RepID=A0A7W7MDK9_9ACTN|nr:nitroreductase [Actinoplanes lobatus]MBB4746327.1 nitroreductase [Actinoplanes lobatus]GGN60630.1 NAD(P)H nitroreductase [Actinoplanes lobatus]GIE41217.1 NAD(P)H nitroreductase [Actinoplanes lobatus]
MRHADEVKRALVQAADAGRFAPSIHNTQPWRWVVRDGALELYGVAERQLHEQDPSGRMLLLSCGTALHHARVALDAEGWSHEVEYSADEPLAVVRPVRQVPVRPEATRHFQMLQVRRTDRRTVTDERLPADTLRHLVKITEEAGGRLHVLGRDQVIALAVAVDRAQHAESADGRLVAETAAWVGGERAEGTGIPASALPEEVPLTTVAERDFGTKGTLAAGDGHDRAATYAVLYGDGDSPEDWLRAGEALSALWLAATEQAVNLLPLSGPVEIAYTRRTLRRMLGDVGFPYLAMRLGTLDPAHSAPPRTPRLPAGQIIDIVPG